jgi:multidrug transporter EmrE-like cation transporter
MNLISFSLILTGVLLNAAAQLLLKAGTNVLGVIGINKGQILSLVFGVFTEPHIIGGLTCYVFSVAIWIIALSRVDVSVAYPMLSIGYIVNALAAWYLFGEDISLTKIIGIGIIIVGVCFVSRG